jgi:hypothetical protein
MPTRVTLTADEHSSSGLVVPSAYVEGEAGSPVAVVVLPGRRAAGGRPQAGLDVVWKSLTRLHGLCRVNARSREFVAQVNRCETLADL